MFEEGDPILNPFWTWERVEGFEIRGNAVILSSPHHDPSFAAVNVLNILKK